MRRQRNGDGGLAVHVLADIGGSKGKAYVEETEVLAFDCFWQGAHYHYGPRNKNHRINWDMTIIDDPLEWTFEQIEYRKLGAMIERAGYPGIAADLDLDKIAAVVLALKKRAFGDGRGRRAVDRAQGAADRVHPEPPLPNSSLRGRVAAYRHSAAKSRGPRPRAPLLWVPAFAGMTVVAGMTV